MKKHILPLILILLAQVASAQIKVYENQIIEVGESVIRETDTIPNISGFQNTGAGLNWDFTGHNIHSTATTSAVNPATTPYASDFPSSNLSMTNDNVNFLYFQSSAAALYAQGLAGDFFGNGTSIAAQLNPPTITYDYPLEYLKTYSGNYTIVEAVDGSQFNVDSVRLNRTASHTNAVEAYGKVETNYGIFKTVKDKRIEYTKDEIYAYFSILPGIIPPTWSLVTTVFDTTVNYYWHTREGKLPVAEVSTNLQNDIDSTTLIITQAVPEPLANFGFEDACVGDVVQFSDSSIQNPTSWRWNFGDGNTSTDQNPTHTYIGSGQFTVQLIVDRNYPDTLEKTITINGVNADAGSDEDICPGNSVTLTATGGVSYEWSNNDMIASTSVSPSTTSTYSVTVTAANGCTASDQVIVNVLDEPSPALYDAVICNSNPVTLDAGNPGATYDWSTNDTSQTISVGVPNTYVVTVTDPSGCSITDTAVVTAGSNLSVPLTDLDACEGDTVVLNAGNPGADYTWSTGDTTRTISVTIGNTYSVTVDDQGCSGSGSSTVSYHANPTPEILGDSIICSGESTYLFVNTTDAITWSTQSGNDSIMVNPGADQYYSVEFEDGFGCTGTDSVLVIVNALPNAQITGNTEICIGDQTTLTAGGGVDFDWSNNDTTTSIVVDPSTNQSYSVVVTDVNGCSDNAQVNVTVNPLPIATIVGPDETCSGESVTLTASGGLDFDWSNNDTTASVEVSPVTSTTYSVTVTDANSCSADTVKDILVNALPSVSFSFDDTTVCLDQLDTLVLSASPAGGSYTGLGVVGNSLALQEIADANLTSSYVFYSYTDNNGCSAMDSLLVELGPCPGINDVSSFEFDLYPNPTNNGFYISSPEFGNERITIVLTDLSGKIHYTGYAVSNREFIATHDFANGMYLLTGRNQQGQILLQGKVQVLH